MVNLHNLYSLICKFIFSSGDSDQSGHSHTQVFRSSMHDTLMSSQKNKSLAFSTLITNQLYTFWTLTSKTVRQRARTCGRWRWSHGSWSGWSGRYSSASSWRPPRAPAHLQRSRSAVSGAPAACGPQSSGESLRSQTLSGKTAEKRGFVRHLGSHHYCDVIRKYI